MNMIQSFMKKKTNNAMRETILLLFSFFSITNLLAQPDSITPKKLPPTEVNILFNYYEQDGNNSAVTGGIGTEKLDDYSTTIIVKAPVDSLYTFDINAGANLYSSASTDKINAISSASGEDLHGFMNMRLDKKNTSKNSNIGLTFGGSAETDYMSVTVGGYYTKRSKDDNQEWTIAAQVYWDRWQLFFADELRGIVGEYPWTDKRRSFSVSGTWSQVVNKRLQVSITSDLVWQHGLLSTPFHRVYVQPDTSLTFEWLPHSRFKHPTAARLNYFISDFAVSRFYGRFYWDSFGIRAGTFDWELPIKLGNSWTFTPFYRYHTQTASLYFQPYAMHSPASEFHTSDYDLSAFQSHKYGLAVKLSPLYGVARWHFLKIFIC